VLADAGIAIAGHVDSHAGPAVFVTLCAVRPGAVVRIDEADGTALRFVVDRVRNYSKDHLPIAAEPGSRVSQGQPDKRFCATSRHDAGRRRLRVRAVLGEGR
jgi:hypothetical protein